MVSKIIKGPKSAFKKETRGVGEYFFDSAAKHGDKICQIDCATGQKESFISVRERSTRAAIHMRELGVGAEDVVLFCLRNNLDNIIPVMATLYLGTKVSAVDSTLSARDCAHCIRIVKPKLIFVEEDCVELIENSLLEANFQAGIVVMGESDKYKKFADLQKAAAEEKEFRPTSIIDCHDTAFVLFSSGTTGLPKGICITHFGLLNSVIAFLEVDHAKPDVTMGFTFLYWITAVVLITSSFITGGCRVLPSKFDAQNALEIIQTYKVTYMTIPAGYTYSFTNLATFKNYDITSLHGIAIVGTPISNLQLLKTKQFFKDSFVTIIYGFTEMSCCVIYFDNTRDKDLLHKINSSGKCSADVQIKVVDIETRKLLGPNQKGELCLKSPYAMKSYYNMDSSVIYDEEGFIKSGDVGYYDEDECFYIIDRIKEMFKYRAWHVVPLSLEILLQEHPAINEAAVFGIPHEIDEFHPAACVTLKDNTTVTEEEIQEFVSSRVSEWHKLRGGIKIVDSMSKTTTGKIQRGKMRDVFLIN